MNNQLLLLHSPDAICGCKPPRMGRANRGGSKMRRCVAWQTTYSPATGGNVRRCARYSGTSGGFLGGLPALGQATTLRETLPDVIAIAKTGAIAAGGVLITDKVFNLIAARLEMAGWQRHFAELVTGVAIGIVVGKVLKRPLLGTTLAIGPAAFAALRLLGELLNVGPYAGGLSGLGLVSVEPYRYTAGTPALAAAQIGPGTPSWMFQPEDSMAGALAGA